VRGLVVDGVGVPIIHALPLTNLICKPRGRHRAPVVASLSPLQNPSRRFSPAVVVLVETRPVDLIATWPTSHLSVVVDARDATFAVMSLERMSSLDRD